MFRSKNWKTTEQKESWSVPVHVPVARTCTSPFAHSSPREASTALFRCVAGESERNIRPPRLEMSRCAYAYAVRGPIDTRPPAQPGILFLPRLSRLIFLSFLLSVFLILLLLPFQPSRRPWFVCSVFSKSPPAAASPIVKSTIRL